MNNLNLPGQDRVTGQGIVQHQTIHSRSGGYLLRHSLNGFVVTIGEEGACKEATRLLARAKQSLLSPIVTGPLRTPKNIPFIAKAQGAHVQDVDGHDYVDITMAYGPLILGHSHPLERSLRN